MMDKAQHERMLISIPLHSMQTTIDARQCIRRPLRGHQAVEVFVEKHAGGGCEGGKTPGWDWGTECVGLGGGVGVLPGCWDWGVGGLGLVGVGGWQVKVGDGKGQRAWALRVGCMEDGGDGRFGVPAAGIGGPGSAAVRRFLFSKRKPPDPVR